jgi:hypothetical protein
MTQMSQTDGVLATLRFFFAEKRVGERNRDITSTMDQFMI